MEIHGIREHITEVTAIVGYAIASIITILHTVAGLTGQFANAKKRILQHLGGLTKKTNVWNTVCCRGFYA